MAFSCVHGAGLKINFGETRCWCALFGKSAPKFKNMAEMSWVEQLRQYNARHAKNKAGKLWYLNPYSSEAFKLFGFVYESRGRRSPVPVEGGRG